MNRGREWVEGKREGMRKGGRKKAEREVEGKSQGSVNATPSLISDRLTWMTG